MTKVRHILSRLAIVLILVAAVTNTSFATDLRGQVIGQYANGYRAPLYGARVDLYVYNGVQWTLLYTWMTGEDGMYYMKGIRPGTYLVQVNYRWNYTINVTGSAYQDIPQFIVPF
jgi:hypothetical protein